MKKLQFIFACSILLFTLSSQAQVSLTVNINSRPDWAREYEETTEYLYYPEIETYYNINTGIFIYFGTGGWIRSSSLPPYCRGYDYQHAHRYPIDYRGNAPYGHFKQHKVKYYQSNDRNYRREYYKSGNSGNRPGNSGSPNFKGGNNGGNHSGNSGGGHGGNGGGNKGGQGKGSKGHGHGK